MAVSSFMQACVSETKQKKASSPLHRATNKPVKPTGSKGQTVDFKVPDSWLCTPLVPVRKRQRQADLC